jgi:predicted metal-dependent hydrolase
MTRKDYILIAKIIKANADRYYEHDSLDVIRELVDDLAAALKEDNPRFEMSLFISACGLEADKSLESNRPKVRATMNDAPTYGGSEP